MVVALLFSVPMAGSAAPEDELNYSPEAAAEYGLTEEYVADPYTIPVIGSLTFYKLDDIFTFEVKAKKATMIDVHVTDCCISGDWWRANVVSLVRRTEMADTTHSTQTAPGIPAANDSTWSPAAIVTKTPPRTMKAIITITAGNHIPGGFGAGMWVKFTTDGTSLTITPIPPKGEKYAVLICGDTPYTAYEAYIDGTGAWSGGLEDGTRGEGEYQPGFDEFWNDTVRMYDILVNKAGFDPNNVVVLWGDGTDWSSSHPTSVCDKYDASIVDYAATMGNVQGIFGVLAGVMTSNDSLFVWTFDHGATGPGRDSRTRGDSFLCLMDGWMTDVEFAELMNAIPYKYRTIFMQQCFSGGFIDDLTRGRDGRKTAIYTACRGDESGWRADDVNIPPGCVWENEDCWDSHSSSMLIAWHGEFDYYFMNALEWLTTEGTTVNADANGDGSVCSYEAFLWALAHDSVAAENPQYKDRGKVGWCWIVTNE